MIKIIEKWTTQLDTEKLQNCSENDSTGHKLVLQDTCYSGYLNPE